jgi:phosphoglucomutase
MQIDELAGKPVPESMLVNIPRLVSSYYTREPDASNRRQKVSFGTSGHRGSSLQSSFNEAHVLAIVQAVCDYRRNNQITGPLFLGMDTHALSEAGHATALEVLAANRIDVFYQKAFGYTPTPVISHAILSYNRDNKSSLCDGIVITPSHNPPEDGGLKYNPPHGGPAGTAITEWIENRANTLLENGNKDVARMPFERATSLATVQEYDFVKPYVDDLQNVIDMEILCSSKIKIGVDPLGGSEIDYWDPIADKYRLDISVVNTSTDPDFRFMTVDKDGKVRMDCSSQYAMAGLIRLKDDFDIAFGNDPDCDRHGIVSPYGGLMSPNHYFCVAIDYLYHNRPQWKKNLAIGKTLVSSSLIDRIADSCSITLYETPVGFKWFVDGLFNGDCGFCCEESAGASFLRKDGSVWSTDKDGMIMDLLAAEIRENTDRDLAELYDDITAKLGNPVFKRIDAPATPAQKTVLKNLSPEHIKTTTLAGEIIRAKLTTAPGNGAPIGGLKVVTENGWFAARPSGTEDIYKIYMESFEGRDHLSRIQKDAVQIIDEAFQS